MKSYKTKSKIRSRNKNKSKTRSRSRNKIKLSSKSKKWDVLVHAIHDISALEYISKNKMLKCPEKQINNWLLDNSTKHNFGNYFNYGNNRYNVIKLLTKNIDKINLLQYKQNINKKELKDDNIQKSDNINWIYTPAVYTSYIFSDLIYEEDKPFFGIHPPILFVISSKILKDKPFICCEDMQYGNCVNLAYYFYTFKKGFYGKGNLKRKPSMKELKDHVNKKIFKFDDFKRHYFSSHEIMFDNIPFEYVNAIFYNDKVIIYEQLRKLFPQKNIHIVKLPTKQIINKDNKLVEIPDYKNYKKFLEPYSY